jgi:hypothetical protein
MDTSVSEEYVAPSSTRKPEVAGSVYMVAILYPTIQHHGQPHAEVNYEPFVGKSTVLLEFHVKQGHVGPI